MVWGINFTGHNDLDDRGIATKLPCPAEFNRGLKSINSWHGNIAMTPDREKEQEEHFAEISRVLKESSDARHNKSTSQRDEQNQ